ncbi:MAG: hypothetical protein JSR18_06335 [Proteobacteria bacterium]|nr:hypothetical protein [Pseudomonadota bacterium]
MTDAALSTDDREWLQMIAQRAVGPVPIDDALMVKFVRMGLVVDDGSRPALTEQGRAELPRTH